MADVNFNRGYKESISQTSIVPFKEGSISIAEDSQELYIDGKDNKRIRITDVIDITGITDPTLINGKIYINGNKLQKVENGKLVDVSSVGNSVLNVDDQINQFSNTKGTLSSSVGKVGDFIIDSKGNIGIVTEVTKSSTTLQIVSMNGEENQKPEYFVYVGDKSGSKNLGTVENPYTSINTLIKDLKNLSKKIVLNIVSDGFEFNEIKDWNNVIINGNGFSISFKTFINCKNIQLNNCTSNMSVQYGIEESSNISIINSEIRLIINKCENVTIDNVNANDIEFSYCKKLNINEIYSTQNKYTNVKLNRCYSTTVAISNSNCSIASNDSFYQSDENDETTKQTDLQILINNSILNTLNIDSYVKELRLTSGSYKGNSDNLKIKANKVYLGTFEFLANPIYGETTEIIDEVGLTSKQVYDEKTRNYGNTKKNLESHLDAIDKSLDNINDSISSLTEEGSGLAEAYVSKGTFKVATDLDKKWRTGDVMKFVASTPIEISKEYPIDIYQMLDVTEVDTNEDEEESATSEEKKYFDFYFISNSKLPYFAHYADIINITLVEGVNSTDYELPIHYCDENNIICRLEQTDANKLIFTPFKSVNTTEKNKYTNCLFNHKITLNKDDRIIYLHDDWDKLVSSSDSASGNYRIVNTRPELNFIMTDDTRPVGMLAYVVKDEIMYQWKEKNGILQWVTFSSGTGGGSDTAKLNVIDKSPMYGLSINDEVYLTIEVYNCTTGTISVSYNVKGKGIRKLPPITVNGPTTETVTLKDFKLDIDAGTNAITLITSVAFTSSDSKVANPPSVNNMFYLGSTISVDYDKINGIEGSGKYTLKDDTISNSYNVDSYLLTSDFNVDNCSFDFNVISVSDEKYKIRCLLYKNDELLNTVSSDNISGTEKITLQFPSLMSDNKTPIVYDAGIYKIEYYAETTESKSSTMTYKFILEDNIAPKIFILNNIEDKLVTADTTSINLNIIYVSIFNKDNYNLTINPVITNAENVEIYTSEESVNIRNKTYNETGIIISDDYNQLLSNIKQNDAYQKNSINIKYNDLISNSKSLVFNVKDSILIIKDRLLYNLSSLGKSNLTSDKYNWISTIVKNDNLQVNLSSFDYSDTGWIESKTEDSGIVSVLTGDGYETAGSINLSPLYKYDDNIFTSQTDVYDVNKGYTVQIKFKANKTNDNGTILECIDEQGKGFLITENKVIFSPYKAFTTNYYGDTQILGSGLMTDEWHEITFVVTVDGDGNNKSPYEQYMYDSDMYNNTGATTCKSCAFLYIDGILSGMTYGNGNDGTDPNNPAQWYSTSIVNERLMTIFARYNYAEKSYYDFGKGQIMHIRQYNKALTPEEILTNYIADIHDETIQNKYVVKNGLQEVANGYEFGYNSDEALPTLHFYNADLSQLDSIMGVGSKDYEYPNVTLTLKYRGKTLFRHYGCEVKVQGTSSTNYAIKNYRIRFYDYKVTDADKVEANITDDDQLSNFMLPNDRIFKNNENTNAYDSKKYNTLWKSDDIKRKSYKGSDSKLYGKGKKLKESVNGWLPESRYTLKADYMDSSHTHNTGTARLANEYMPEIPPQKIENTNPYNITNPDDYTDVSIKIEDITSDTTQEQVQELTPVNPVNQIRQAIDGFPILITYSCPSDPKDKNSTPISTIQKGIYMFNLDKSANFNFGYEEYKNACKSYEVSNNEVVGSSNAAGFNVDVLNIDDSYPTINDNPLMQVKNEIEARYHYNEELNEDTMDELVDKLKTTFNITDDVSTSSGITIDYVNGDDYSQGIKIEAPLSLANGLDKTHDELRSLLASDEYGYTRIIGRYEDEYGNLVKHIKDIYNEDTEYIHEELIKISNEVQVSSANTKLRSCVLSFNGIAINPIDEKLVLGLTSTAYDNYLYDSDTHQNDELKHLLMWFKYCTVNPTEFATNWDKHLSLTNMEHYIILVKCLGMVDNLAKNMMITTWDADKEYIVYIVKSDGKLDVNWSKSTFAKWYLQFYDLDTSFGLTNDGHLDHEVSLDIKGHSMDDIHIPDNVNKNSITDISTSTFNAYNSNLWNQLFNAYDKVNYGKTGIENSLQATYANIRSRDVNPLTVETFTKYIINSITDVIGEYYFNLDALNKYFGWNFIKPSDVSITNPFNSKKYFYMCLGSAKNQMLNWLNNRLIYVDTYYSYKTGNSDVRPNTNNEGANVFIKPITSLYYYIQTADDSNIIPQLLTGQAINTITYNITSDANQVWPYLQYISEISNLGLLKAKVLNLLNASNLVRINLGDCNTLTELHLSSEYLKELNASNLQLSTLNIENLKNLVDLDISNSLISTLQTGNVNLRKLNITGSNLTNVDLSGLTKLESLGKVNISTNSNWNTYDKFINQLETLFLIPKLPANTSDETYNDKLLERNNYLNNVLKQFKETLSLRSLLDEFINATKNLSDVNDLLNYIFNNSKYINVIGEQYIQNLAIINSAKSFDTIKLNSEKLKAVYLDCTTSAGYIGKSDGQISIIGDNIKYIKINNIDLSLPEDNDDNKRLVIKCKNVEDLSITNSKYSNVLDLSTCESIKNLYLINNHYIDGVLISQKCRDNGTIKTIDINQNWNLKFICTENEYSDEVNLIDLTNFNLTHLVMRNVVYFTKIKGLNLTLSDTDDFDMSLHTSTTGTTSTDPNMLPTLNKFYNNGTNYANYENCIISITKSMIFSRKFIGRCNMIFNFGKSNGLTIQGINNVTNFNYTFSSCWNLTLDDVYYLLGVEKISNSNNVRSISGNNKPTKCVSFSMMFSYCVGINFPIITSGSSKKRLVPGKLFVNCNSAQYMDHMFGGISRKHYDGLTFEVNYSDGNKESKIGSLILDNGLFHILKLNSTTSYIDTLNITGIFSNVGLEINSSVNHQYDITLPSINDNYEKSTNFTRCFNSYIYAVYDNVFEKLTNLTSIGNESAYNIFSKNSDSDTTSIKFIIKTSTNNSTYNTAFYHLIKNCNSFTYKLLFAKTSIIKWANTLNDAIANSSSTRALAINSNIFKNRAGAFRTINSLYGTFAYFNTGITLNYLYEDNSSQYPDLAFKFNLFGTIETKADTSSTDNDNYINITASNGIDLSYCFYKNLAITKFDPTMFIKIYYNESTYMQRIKVNNTRYMFAECTNMTGLFIRAIKNVDNDNTYYEPWTNWNNFNIFTSQTSLSSIEGMFLNCTKLGGLVTKNIDNDGTITYNKQNDLPTNIFEELENCVSMNQLFENCISMRFDFSKFDVDSSNYQYLFKNCYKLKDIGSMFNKCTGLVRKLPSYGNKGSKREEVAYFYYDILGSIKYWLENITLATTIVKYATEGYFTYPDGYSPYQVDDNGKPILDDNGNVILANDEWQQRIIMIDKIINESSDWKSIFKQCNIVYEKNEQGQTTTKVQNIYQYYKAYENCDEIIGDYTNKDNELIHGSVYPPTGMTNNEEFIKNIHNQYIRNEGFFYISRNDINKNNTSPLINIAGVFNNCTNLKHGIPSNIFKNMSNVLKSGYLFNNGSSIGFDEATYDTETAFNATESQGNGLDCTPPYCITYGLFDDLINTTTLECALYNVRHLSKPYNRVLYYPNAFSIAPDTYGDAYDERYCIPKYFLYYNTKLTSTRYMFGTAGTTNYLFGIINENMFANNKEIKNIAGMFANTSVVGCKKHPEYIYNNTMSKYYIGQQLLYPLTNLENASYLFYGCKSPLFCLTYVSSDNKTRDLLFSSKQHKLLNLNTSNLILNSSLYSIYTTLFNNKEKAKLVKNENATDLNYDYQCYQYFTSAKSNETLEKYIES